VDNTNLFLNKANIQYLVLSYIQSIPHRYANIFLSSHGGEQKLLKSNFLIDSKEGDGLQLPDLYVEYFETQIGKREGRLSSQTVFFKKTDHRLILMACPTQREDRSLENELDHFIQSLIIEDWQHIVVETSDLEGALVKIFSIYTQGYQKKNSIPFHYKVKT
jgi:hypothetical protein